MPVPYRWSSKAQGLVEVLQQRWAEDDSRFAFDLGSLVADSGAAVVSLLAHQGVVVVSVAQQEGVEGDTPPELECALRAAAVVACQGLAQQLGLSMGGVGAALARRCFAREDASVQYCMRNSSTVAW